MEEHPDGTSLARRAREIALQLTYMERPENAERLSADIWTGVEGRLDLIPSIPLQKQRSLPRWSYWAAACLLGLVITGAVLLFHKPRSQPAMPQVATLLVNKDLQRTNLTQTDHEVLLVDGSKVILQPGASIRHAAFLQSDKREVYLEGNAFFEIAKDAGRPFYVYTKDLVVRVLGTSFNVTTNKDNGDVTVLVHSGKVAVSKKTNPAKQQLILVSNQQVLYKEQTHDLISASEGQGKPASDQPQAVASIPFHFEETPVVEIFQTLENAYGIPLHYNKQVFSACMITTSLADETFEEKLKIICEAIGATYKIDGNGVYIDGKPCKE